MTNTIKLKGLGGYHPIGDKNSIKNNKFQLAQFKTISTRKIQ